MASLAITLADLVAEVGQYLGFGRDYTSWSGWNVNKPFVPSDVLVSGQGLAVDTPAANTKLAMVMACIKSGLSQVYWPPRSDNGISHRWSFLIPEYSFPGAVGKSEYNLPDDFNGFEGDLTIADSGAAYTPLDRIGIGVIRQMLAESPGLVGIPRKYAVSPKPTDGSSPQKWLLTLFPTPGAVYTFYGRYNVLPEALDVARIHPYGGATHGELIKQSCLYAAERDVNHEVNGVHGQAYSKCLQGSIDADVRGMAPDNYGLNHDPSARRRTTWLPHMQNQLINYP